MSQYQIVTIQNIIKCPAMKNKFLIYYNKNVNLYNKQYNNSCTFVNYCVVLVNYSVVRLLMISIRYSEQVRVMVFQQYFRYIVADSFIGGGNQSTQRKPSTCRKSLVNLITQCCIKYTSPERYSNSQRQWIFGMQDQLYYESTTVITVTNHQYMQIYI